MKYSTCWETCPITSGMTLPMMSRCAVAPRPVRSGSRRRMASRAAALAIAAYWAHSGALSPPNTPMLRRISSPTAEQANMARARTASARR